MVKSCKKCTKPFTLQKEDYEVFAHFDVQPPTLCPGCRQQRRTAFRNERSLHHRECDKCNKMHVSLYSADKPWKVYCSTCFWSDGWDPRDAGRKIDFNRPFLEQFKELMLDVPWLSNMVFSSQNSEFNSFCIDSKDCYLSQRVGDCESALYSYLVVHCDFCLDCYNAYKCSYCYECVDCWNCYNCSYCQLCKNTSDSYLCYDLIGCKKCFGCIGLRNKEYYAFNKKCSPEEYEQIVQKWNNGSFATRENLRKKFQEEVVMKNPQRALYNVNTENVSESNYVTNSKDVHNCFDIEKTETCRNSWGIEYSKDVYDGSFLYYAENCYEQISNTRSSNLIGAFAMVSNVHDIAYSMMCFNNTHDCIGCASMNKNEYCILNKQYTKEEYEALKPRVIQKLKDEKLWGEFFPIEMSQFGYNETPAQEYFPLSEEEAKAKGYNWLEQETREQENKRTKDLPDNIKDVPESITKEILSCTTCDKNYKIIPRELKWYKEHNTPLPRVCPDCRYKARMKLRNPRKMWERDCEHCHQDVKSTIEPKRPETVYCNSCYIETVN